jgi:hypothetical protein
LFACVPVYWSWVSPQLSHHLSLASASPYTYPPFNSF